MAPSCRRSHWMFGRTIGKCSIAGFSKHLELAAAKTAHDKTVFQREIDSTDAEIDRLAYDLYGVTADEIAVVEGEGS